MKKDLKIIKKKYGEDMMKFCRREFPAILESEGLLVKILTNNFAENHVLYDDIKDMADDFVNFIISECGQLVSSDIEKTNKNPYELLEMAGYDLYKCTTEEEIQKFKKYYAKDEELCTFRGGRLKKCYVYFAVKKNVADIKREDFLTPERDDLYGTSVLSIQFTRDDFHRLSIKSRYNHTVKNPDATLSNNLDNIIPGLTYSFAKYEEIIQRSGVKKRLKIPGYVRARDNKYYKYNSKVGNVYFCPNNIIIDNGVVKMYNKDNYLIMDNYILNLKTKEIFNYNEIQDGFVDTLTDITKIKVVNQQNKEIHLETNKGHASITLNDNNQIIGYSNDYVEEIKDNAFLTNNALTKLELPKVKTIGNNVLPDNDTLGSLYLPKVKTIGDQFLYFNRVLAFIDTPNLEKIGNYFLCRNYNLKSIILPSVKVIGNIFLECNREISNFEAANLEKVGCCFLGGNHALKSLKLPSVKVIDNSFLHFNKELTYFEAPKLERIGDNFLSHSRITSIILPSVKVIGDDFLYLNEALTTLYTPNLETVGVNFLLLNCNPINWYCPMLEQNSYNIENTNCYVLRLKR